MLAQGQEKVEVDPVEEQQTFFKPSESPKEDKQNKRLSVVRETSELDVIPKKDLIIPMVLENADSIPISPKVPLLRIPVAIPEKILAEIIMSDSSSNKGSQEQKETSVNISHENLPAPEELATFSPDKFEKTSESE